MTCFWLIVAWYWIFALQVTTNRRNYSGAPPYGHPINTATSLLWPLYFGQTKAQSVIFLFATLLLRPVFFGPKVSVLTGFHCTWYVSLQSYSVHHQYWIFQDKFTFVWLIIIITCIIIHHSDLDKGKCTCNYLMSCQMSRQSNSFLSPQSPCLVPAHQGLVQWNFSWQAPQWTVLWSSLAHVAVMKKKLRENKMLFKNNYHWYKLENYSWTTGDIMDTSRRQTPLVSGHLVTFPATCTYKHC